MELAGNANGVRWTVAATDRLLIASVALLLLAAFFSGLRDLVTVWDTQEEYSFGYMIPVVTLYLLFQRREHLAATDFTGSWWGVVVVVAGLLLLGVGQIGTLGTVVQYAFLISLLGLVLAYTGYRGFAAVAAPLAILAFMVPLPNYLLREVSQVLQLWSSQLGVMVIRAFGITVFLEGNVIDLGNLRLQVVEACSGLRYLFPLMAIGFIAAILFRAAFWKQAVLFLSTIPITVAMNSARIGIVGVLSEHYGKSMAQGFLHDFEGWAVFMVCMALLVGEIALLARVGSVKTTLAESFSLQAPALRRAGRVRQRVLPRPFLAAGSLVALAAAASTIFTVPSVALPERRPFSEFPIEFGGWQGTRGQLERDYLQLLKLDDYLLADFASADGHPPINLYVSYHATQANGNAAHSPRACIPGDGWEIIDFGQRRLPGIDVGGEPLTVNRAVIQRGDSRQLVYYWFQQRGRATTNEYVVKLHIFWDAITRHRTDGAMVRLVARLLPGDAVESGDARLERFAALAVPPLANHVPD